MPWETGYLKVPGVLSVRVWGEVTPSTWRHLLEESIKQARVRSCIRFLIDYRESDIKMSLVELFNRPAAYAELGMTRQARIALIFEDGYSDIDFIETVTQNRCYNVKVFNSPETALSWLMSKPRWNSGSCPTG